MRYFAYIRKSSKEKNRQVQSIPKQYEWIKKEAIRRGIKIDSFFEDSRSGHELGRAGFEKMTEEVEKSKTPIGIITWKISRLSRNPIDEGIIKYAFVRGKIRHYSPPELHVLFPALPAGTKIRKLCYFKTIQSCTSPG